MIDRHIAKLRHCELGLGLRMGLSGGASFNPAILFANGEQGAWFDPSDLSTLFQDSAGTTAGAVGQAVGLQLDKSKGLAVGAELLGTGTTGLVGSATAAAYNTSTGAGSVTRVDGANQSFVSFASLTAINFYKVRIVNTGAVDLLVRAANSGGALVQTIVAGATFDGYISGQTTYVLTTASGGGTASFTVTSFKHIAGNHAFQSTAASRPILRQSAGGLLYLEYDGVDDFLVTNAIDFSASDKVAVFAGVRALANERIVLELSPSLDTNNGSFYVYKSSSGWGFGSKGTVASEPNATTYVPPITNVLTGLGDIGGDSAILRVNGSQSATSATDQGTGNFGNYALYRGRRGGASLSFNGWDFGTIIRGGASTDVLITQTEAWLANKTGVSF